MVINCCRELNHMLKAWEAMRLGKDAQIAALMERCKRHEEDAAEKARTVEALRRKLALAGRPGSSGGPGYSSTSNMGSVFSGGGGGGGGMAGALPATRHSWAALSPSTSTGRSGSAYDSGS